MSIFEDTVSIVREAEHLVIGTRIKSRWWQVESTLDALFHVPWFVLVGVQERLAMFGFALFLVPIWWCLIVALMWVTNGDSAANIHASQGWIIATLLAAGSVLFRLPSRATRLGIRPPQVVSLATHIKSIATDEATLKLLQAGVATLDAAATQRITRIQWLLGLCWAGLAWATSHWVFTTGVTDAVRQEATPRLFGGLLIFLFFGIGTTSYEATVRILKQTIDFAFLEASDVRDAEHVEAAVIPEPSGEGAKWDQTGNTGELG